MFPLLRYFSLASLVVMAVATILSWALYQYFSEKSMVEAEEKRNATLATVLGNSLWPLIQPLAESSKSNPQREGLINHANMPRISAAVQQQLTGLHILKFKMYSKEGITLFSTESSQIGENKSHSLGVQSALRGEVSSELVHKDSVYSLEGTLSNRDLVTSYIPVYDQNGEISAIAEVYSDITEFLIRLNHTLIYMSVILVALFVVVYGVLFVVVRRADQIIRRQHDEREVYQEEILHKASHDLLTNLPNRAHCKERLQQALARAERTERLVGIYFIDLDGFKSVNDNLGHHAGDILLQGVASRISRTVRLQDTVARIGGDEFVVIAEGVHHIDEINLLAKRIIEALSENYSIEGIEVAVTASIGITVFPLDDTDIELLLSNADAAMYAAKQDGKNTYRLFESTLSRRDTQQLTLRTDMRGALDRSEFSLCYQPKLDFQTGRIVGAEALLRWNHPRDGFMLPGKFISMLEESDLIVDVGHWVLDKACEQNCQWQEQGLRPINMAVNVSARQFNNKVFYQQVSSVLERSGMSPQQLELEVTENAIIRDTETSRRIMEDLKKLNIKIAVDDFGTGYSSFTYLRHFPIDILKLDRTFVASMLNDKNNGAIVSAIIALAHRMKLTIVAEGVENEEQYRYLYALRCHEMQGYLYSKPLQPDEFAQLLKDDCELKLEKELAPSVYSSKLKPSH